MISVLSTVEAIGFAESKFCKMCLFGVGYRNNISEDNIKIDLAACRIKLFLFDKGLTYIMFRQIFSTHSYSATIFVCRSHF